MYAYQGVHAIFAHSLYTSFRDSNGASALEQRSPRRVDVRATLSITHSRRVNALPALASNDSTVFCKATRHA